MKEILLDILTIRKNIHGLVNSRKILAPCIKTPGEQTKKRSQNPI